MAILVWLIWCDLRHCKEVSNNDRDTSTIADVYSDPLHSPDFGSSARRPLTCRRGCVPPWSPPQSGQRFRWIIWLVGLTGKWHQNVRLRTLDRRTLRLVDEGVEDSVERPSGITGLALPASSGGTQSLSGSACGSSRRNLDSEACRVRRVLAVLAEAQFLAALVLGGAVGARVSYAPWA